MTTDHEKVRSVVEKIGHSDIKGRATEIEDSYWRLMQDSPGSGAGAAMGVNFRAEAEGARQESKSMAQKYMDKMTAFARSLRLVEGQKHFIFFSTGIPNSLIYGYTPNAAQYRGDTSSASETTCSGGRTRPCIGSLARRDAPSTPSTRGNRPWKRHCSPTTSRRSPRGAGR